MSKDKKWLIKSSDTILGPLEFNHIVESLFKGNIHILDEIKGPFDRWCAIKDNSLFNAALEKLRSSYNRREQTVTATVDINTATRELTKTKELTATRELTATQKSKVKKESTNSYELKKTHKPSAIRKSSTKTLQEQDFNKKNSNFVLESSPREGRRESLMPPPYRKAKSSLNQKNFLIVLSTVFIIAIVFLYRFLEVEKRKRIEKKNAAYNEFSNKALKAMKIGDYQTALKNFNMAYRLSPENYNLLIEMAPLSVQFEGKFSQIHGQLEKFMMDSRDKSFLNYSKNIIGLTHSYRNRHDEALHFYDQITQMDNGFLPALVNKTFSLLKLGRSREAVSFIEKEIKNFPEKSIVHYLYVRSLVEAALNNGEEKILNKALFAGQQFSEKFMEFKQEVLFLMALLRMKVNKNEKEWMKFVEDFLNVDIELTNLHMQDPNIDFQSFNWLDYNLHCEKMQENIDELYLSQLLKGFCLLKINRLVDGKKVFEKLLSKHSQKGLLQSLYASSLFKMNDTNQAKNILNFVDQVDQKQIVVEVTLRNCLLSEDIYCAKRIMNNDNFTKYLSMLYSHWGYGAVFLSENPEQAQVSINLGLEISPNFVPLLRLKRKLH